MLYKFKVTVFLTYKDKEIEVEVDLSDKEVTRIKELVVDSAANRNESADEDDNVPLDLLQILEDNDEKLFDKFWDVIMPPVFVELLIDAMNNFGNDMRLEEDNFKDYRKASFEELYDMYGDSIDMDHSICCDCRIPEDLYKQPV